jgi:hypothetical protein
MSVSLELVKNNIVEELGNKSYRPLHDFFKNAGWEDAAFKLYDTNIKKKFKPQKM